MGKYSKILVIISTITIFALIAYLLYSVDVTNREAGLISLLLTLLSVGVSYIVSNYFAEESYKKAISEVKEEHLANLKVYALNAAEKVGNLSNELTKLSIYIQKELDYDEENLEMLNHSLSERLESVIHIINTLKSVNDTSLSDWRGVIGDELIEQKEEQIERESDIKDLVSRVETLIKGKDSNDAINYGDEIKQIKKELALTINSFSGNLIKQKNSIKPKKQEINANCPMCNSEIIYKQRKNVNSFKTIKCSTCQNKFAAKWSEENGFYLDQERIIEETIACPRCNNKTTIEYNSLPYRNNTCVCTNCSGKIKINTKVNSIEIGQYGLGPIIVNEELIGKIESQLTPQPWEKGIHKKIAKDLGISDEVAREGIQKLIDCGKFNMQINGVVYKKI